MVHRGSAVAFLSAASLIGAGVAAFQQGNRPSLLKQKVLGVYRNKCKPFPYTHCLYAEKSKDRGVDFVEDDVVLEASETKLVTYQSPSVMEQTMDILEDFRSDEAKNQNNGWVSGLVWRGVVAILCALWASNFAAAKLIMAEPGMK